MAYRQTSCLLMLLTEKCEFLQSKSFCQIIDSLKLTIDNEKPSQIINDLTVILFGRNLFKIIDE